MVLRFGFAAAVAVALCCTIDARVVADEWPSRVVKILVPSAPGGSSDAAARLVANHFQAVFRQPFVIENKPGAGGGVGAAHGGPAEPHRPTLVISKTGPHPTLPIGSK